MRVAAVDLGTNTTRLLVADVVDGRLEPVVRREAITRLGESVDRRRVLLPTSIARVRNVLVDYRREAGRLEAERVLAVGTSAVRDAENGEAFLGEVEWSYRFATRLLDGPAEAELMLRGVASARPISDGTVVVDIGGGSTELVTVANGRAVETLSIAAGSVRLTERFLSEPPTQEELEACAARVRELLPDLEAEGAIGVAGTVVSAATILADGVETDADGSRLSRDSVAALVERLAALPLAERERVPGLEAARAPVIVAGLVVLREILDRNGLAGIEVSERDLLDGAALAAAELPAPEDGPVPPSAFTCC